MCPKRKLHGSWRGVESGKGAYECNGKGLGKRPQLGRRGACWLSWGVDRKCLPRSSGPPSGRVRGAGHRSEAEAAPCRPGRALFPWLGLRFCH